MQKIVTILLLLWSGLTWSAPRGADFCDSQEMQAAELELVGEAAQGRVSQVACKALPNTRGQFAVAQYLEQAGDTGRLDLVLGLVDAQGVRAFGVKTSNSTHCTCNNGARSNLSLFVRRGKSLVMVLEDVQISEAAYMGEYDSECGGEMNSSATTIAIGGARHNGYADLVMTTSAPSGSLYDCDAGKNVKTHETWLFDGKLYAPPVKAKK